MLATRVIVAGLLTALLLGGCATVRSTRAPAAPEPEFQAPVLALFLQAQVVLGELRTSGEPDTRAERAAALLEQAIALEPESALLHRYLAEAWASNLDHERAIEAATRAVSLDPTDARAHHLLGTELHVARMPVMAEAHLREAARRGVGGDAPAEPHHRLFRVLQELGREDEAVAACDAWMAALPEDPRPASLKASYLWELGRADEARDSAAAALLSDPRSSEARSILGDYHRFDPTGEAEALERALERHWSARGLHERLSEVYRGMGRYDLALDHLRYVGMLDQGDGDQLRRRASLLGRMHRHAEAVELLVEALEHAEDPFLRLSLADLHVAAGHTGSALAELERVGPDEPGYWRAARLRARIQLDQGEPDRAGETVFAARQLVPPEEPVGRSALLALGIRCEIEQDDFEQIDRMVQELRRSDEQEAHRLRRLALERRGALHEAIRLEEQAIADAPSRVDYWAELASLQAEVGDWDRAMAAFTGGLEIVRIRREAQLADADRSQAFSIREQANNDTADLLLLRSFLEKEEGLGAESEASLRAVLELYPDHAEALNALAYLWAEESRELDEAERLVQRALEQRRYSAAFLDTLGWVRFRQGRLDEALELLQTADDWAGGDPEIAGHVREVLDAIDRLSEAP